ncbi:MAG: hypothetical protein Q9166_007481 [cf. Caloplaca sp. 2 TL-2023]
MSGLGYFFLLVLILIPLAFVCYVFYTRIQARRSGRSPPPLSSYIPFRNRTRQSSNYPSSSGGILSTIRSKFQSLSGSGSHRPGAYEQPLGTRRGRGLDPDGAWDARVGDEADAYGSGGYYEEQELGGLRTGGGYGGHGTELPDYGDEELGRVRSISRDGPGFIGGSQGGLDQRYDEETKRDNPFEDQAERSSMRGISPRPATATEGHKTQASENIQGDSPTERKSMFHENM